MTFCFGGPQPGAANNSDGQVLDKNTQGTKCTDKNTNGKK